MAFLTRGIDLSTASTLALAGMISASLAQNHPELPVIAYIGLAIVTGIVLGFINGSLISFLGIPPIVVTLGTLAVYRGMIVVYGGGNQVNASEMGDVFQSFPKLSVFGLSTLFWIMVVVALGVWLFLSMTRTGRGLYAVGGNPVAARYCGIDLPRQQLLVYTISGAISGLCGYLWVSRYGVAYSEIASGFELTVIAACVIGGVSIAGGVGSVAGTLLGALFLGGGNVERQQPRRDRAAAQGQRVIGHDQQRVYGALAAQHQAFLHARLADGQQVLDLHPLGGKMAAMHVDHPINRLVEGLPAHFIRQIPAVFRREDIVLQRSGTHGKRPLFRWANSLWMGST